MSKEGGPERGWETNAGSREKRGGRGRYQVDALAGLLSLGAAETTWAGKFEGQIAGKSNGLGLCRHEA